MLIKVEAINIGNFIDDTQNLSAVRGAGLMLLALPKVFGGWLEQFGEVRCVTEGASKAVFRLKPRPGSGDIEMTAREWLRREYPHATIALATHDSDSDGFLAADEKLTSEIRRAQMRSFSFAGLPECESSGVCEWDRVRPATARIEAKDGKFRVSEATRVKHDNGREAKRSFLHQHAGLGGDWKYTAHMDELSGCPERGRLNHKICVFYVDGNAFGKTLRMQLENEKPERQEKVIRAFDEYLQKKRRVFLEAVLKETAHSRWQTPGGARRIEVLLWGGDELMLVVPAWCGWETAELFCATMKDAVFPESRIPLKHAMGLVFAHHKAPIHALRRLVRGLAEEAKRQDRKQNLLSYLVLESFDHVGEDLQRFRESRGGVAGTISAENDGLKQIAKQLKWFKDNEFPRRKVYQAVLGLLQGRNWSEFGGDIERFISPEQKKNLGEWMRLSGGGVSASWLHLAELWDYVGVEL